MLVQDSHRSTLLFQLRDWRESLATSLATGHGLAGELFIRFFVTCKEGLIRPNSKYDTFLRNLDENLAKDQSFKVRSGTAYGSGFLFPGVTKRTPEDRSRSRVCH